jgi:predicted MFS family arabinose efflux permease
LMALPVALAVVTLIMLPAGHSFGAAALLAIAWGAVNAAIPVAWSTWLSKGVKDKPESGGGLMVASIQLSIMVGAELGGILLDHYSIGATFLSGAALLVLSAIVVGSGKRLRPAV